jgi:hypothetical protein
MSKLLETSKIHNGADYYDKFCQYAGITFHQDNGCDQYTGITGITEYNNPIITGKIRWNHTLYGDMVTVHSEGSDKLHKDILNKEFVLPEKYLLFGKYIVQFYFENWLNDELWKKENGI